MAKHLIFDYTFDASAKTITLSDTYDQKRFLLITNVTTNQVIYNFADAAAGATFEYFYDPISTVITLTYDTTSMSDTDKLQIFYDADKQSFAPADEYLDPVSKIRVSNPENLIDTDFEYGLQSTKWETLETAANIPTFFSRSGDLDIALTSVTVSNNSDIVEVTTDQDHGLVRGSPIFIQGTTNILGDGGFIVRNVVSSTSFRYQAKGSFSFTGSIKDTYTQLFSAAIYDGTEFKLKNTAGITTDGAAESAVTVTTEFPTKFEAGTQVALTNSYAKASVQFETEDVTTDNSTSFSVSVDETTYEANSEYNIWGVGPFDRHGGMTIGFEQYNNWSGNGTNVKNLIFDPDSITVDTNANTITFDQDLPWNIYSGSSAIYDQNYSYQAPLGFIYMCDPSNTPIGGMVNNGAYWMYKIGARTCKIQNQKSTSSAYTVNLTSAGSGNGMTKDAFIWGMSVTYSRNSGTDYFSVYRDKYIMGQNGYVGSVSHSNVYCATFNNPTYLMGNSGNWVDWNTSTPLNYVNICSDSARGFPTSYYYRGPYWTYYSTNYIKFVYLYRSGRYWYQYDYNYLTANSSNDFVVLNTSASRKAANTLYAPNHGVELYANATGTLTNGTLGGMTFGNLNGLTRLDDNYVSIRPNYYSAGQQSFDNQTVSTNSGSFDLSFARTYQKESSEIDRIEAASDVLSEKDVAVYYNATAKDNSGTDIGGLSDGSSYYVVNKGSDNKFSLASTADPFEGSSFTFQSYLSSVDVTNRTITDANFTSLSTGDAVRYNPVFNDNRYAVAGLNNGGVYWVRKVASNEISLHRTYADATGNTNKVDLIRGSQYTNLATMTPLNFIDLTSVPASTETQVLQADFVGAADGNYSVSSTSADQQSFVMTNGSQVENRAVEIVCQNGFVAEYDGFYLVEHGFKTGQIVTYTTSGTVNISGLTSSTDYYIISVNKDFFKLATTEQNSEDGVAISLTETGALTSESTGTITLSPTDIVGQFSGNGTVDGDSGSTLLVGAETRFLSFFQAGDEIYISGATGQTTHDVTSVSGTTITASGSTFTSAITGKPASWTSHDANQLVFVRYLSGTTISIHYSKTDADAGTNAITVTSYATTNDITIFDTGFGDWIVGEVEHVNDDNAIILKDALSTDVADANYMLQTKVIMRPDGFALHRPYDGGVELIAPVNPNSAMVRQTRKYFRYQSGKGIQVSYAVNFSPSTDIDTYERNNTTATITTRYPHRLTEGLLLKFDGATNSAENIGTYTYDVTVQSDGYNNRYYYNGSLDDFTIYEGRTYRFDLDNVTGHPLVFLQASDDTEYETGVSYYINGTETTRATYIADFDDAATTSKYIEITPATDAPDLKTHCTNHANMGATITILPDQSNGTEVIWNGEYTVASVVDDRTFTVTLSSAPSDPRATGSPNYYVKRWADCALRCGLFDDQNGLFFEYDGYELWCVVRDSTAQLRGTVTVTFRSGEVNGVNTAFASQCSVGDMLVIKGQSYRVVKIDSDILLYIAPSYRGVTRSNVIVSVTRENRVKQSDWNLDVADGTGKSGFKLDLGKIQMAYIDYSWYGAGKVRFGFKDQNGNVKYTHQFAHGNYKTEAYMRSGNMPARYELHNGDSPTYTPALAHWGTSVIMDGTFDPDKAYLFNAASKNIVTTGEDTLTVNGKFETTSNYVEVSYSGFYSILGKALVLDAPNSQLTSYAAGEAISGSGLTSAAQLANPQDPYYTNPYIQQVLTIQQNQNFNRKNFKYRTLLFVNETPSATSGTSSAYSIGTAGADVGIDREIPLISIRLAPSVDTSAPGFLGEREIINRMQLILNSVGILTTHAVSVKLMLNSALNTTDWLRVDNPSLSQLIYHQGGDTISGGASVFNFEASGSTGTSNRTANLTSLDLGEIATLGNSILGGNNTYPDGPDVLTITARINEDVANVSGSNPFIVSARVSWSESQA